jgi:hypothetical protein
LKKNGRNSTRLMKIRIQTREVKKFLFFYSAFRKFLEV